MNAAAARLVYRFGPACKRAAKASERSRVPLGDDTRTIGSGSAEFRVSSFQFQTAHRDPV